MLGDLIAGFTKIIGGAIDRKANQRAADAANATQMAIADKNIALQKEFAQHGVRWKVEDAKAAGLHPLYAMGGQTHSFAPVSVGTVSPSSDFGRSLADAGQDIGRAVNATRTSGEREVAFNDAVQGLQLENWSLQNEMLKSQIAKLNATQSPAFPGEVPMVESAGRPPLMFNGQVIETDPGTSSAEDFSFRGGEPAEWLAAAPIIWQDYRHNVPVERELYMVPGGLADRVYRWFTQ